MAYGVKVHNLPGCSSYLGAKKIWDEAKDCSKLAVWGEDSRPLDTVRMRHKAVTKHRDGSYSMDLYMTEMIRYYPDGSISGTFDDRSASTNFFWRMAPKGAQLLNIDGATYLRYLDSNDVDHYVKPEHGHSTFCLKPAGRTDTWELTSRTLQRTRTVANRKKCLAIQKAFAGFFEWERGVTKLTGKSPVDQASQFRGAASLGITMPPTTDQYARITMLGKDLTTVKQRLNEHFGGYIQVDIPNTELPRKSTIGRWNDS